MVYRFALPDLGEGIADGEVVRWHVEPGQWVSEGDPLLEIETEKAIVEIPSPQTGRVSRLEVAAGATVPVGTVLVVVETEDGAEAEAPSPVGSPGDGGREPRPQASPRVRRLARELGVDLDAVAARVGDRPLTEADLRAAADNQGDAAADKHLAVRGVRGRIVRRLSRIQREVPAVTVVDECDFTALENALSGFARTAFVLKVVSAALADVPELNATFGKDRVTLHERHDIGLAVQVAEGLVVPVVRGVERRPLDALADDVRRLTDGARERRLAPTELTGSTFTVTEAGRLGGLFATPLVNMPEVGVLGLHRVDQRPVVREGEVAVRLIGNVSCTFDHRALDGFHAGTFLLRFIELVEQAETLLADDGALLQAGGRRAEGAGLELGRQLAAAAEPERGPIVLELVCEHVAALRREVEPVDPHRTFKDLGLSSLAAVELRNSLEAATGLPLEAALAFHHPTPAEVAEHLLTLLSPAPGDSPP